MRTNDKFYTLGELAAPVDLSEQRNYGRSQEAERHVISLDRIEVILDGERNDTVFHVARKMTYHSVKHCGSYEELFAVVMQNVALVNLKCLPELSGREVKVIAGSIASWCWRNRKELSQNVKNRGVLNLPPMPSVMEASKRLDEVKSRQAAGADYVNEKRAKETETRITQAVEQLKAEGKRITKTAVARITGMDRKELGKRYAHLFP